MCWILSDKPAGPSCPYPTLSKERADLDQLQGDNLEGGCFQPDRSSSGAVGHTRLLMPTVWLMKGVLGHTVPVWPLEGLKTEQVRSATQTVYPYVTDPQQHTWKARPGRAALADTMSYASSHIIIGRTKNRPFCSTGKRQRDACSRSLLDSVPQFLYLCRFSLISSCYDKP